jgi:hypothetical protein
VAAGAAAAAAVAGAAASVVAAVAGLLAAEGAAAAVVAAAAGSVASGSVAAWLAWLAWVGAGVAADPGERAACAKSRGKRRCDGRRITSGLAQQSVGRHFAKVHKSCLLTANTYDGQYLPLALDNALKRMPMFAGKRDHLRRLCLSYFVRVSPALGDYFIMNAEHEMHCTFAIHVEELFDGVHDKFHWSAIVVQDQHTPCRALGATQIGRLLSPRSLWQGLLLEWRL